jgi:uncharacterized glyoxalase superfamily protein PhnB
MAGAKHVEIHPVLHYADPDKALQFLAEAFGFRENAVYRDPEGNVAYAEMELGGAPLGFGGQTDGSPFDLGPTAIYIVLESGAAIDAHHEHAVAAGVEIVMPPTDQDYGSRDYAARDFEGNVWCFGTFRPGTPAG